MKTAVYQIVTLTDDKYPTQGADVVRIGPVALMPDYYLCADLMEVMEKVKALHNCCKQAGADIRWGLLDLVSGALAHLDTGSLDT